MGFGQKLIMSNIFITPSKKILVIILITWFISVSILVLAVTNLFTESVFQRKFLAVNGLILSSTLSIRIIIRNYLRGKK
jgi:hypothetical protein